MAVVPAFNAVVIAISVASCSDKPILMAVAYVSSNAPAAVPPNASAISNASAEPTFTPVTLAAILAVYAEPPRNRAAFATLPTPPDTKKIGISCRISPATFSARNCTGCSWMLPHMAWAFKNPFSAMLGSSPGLSSRHFLS